MGRLAHVASEGALIFLLSVLCLVVWKILVGQISLKNIFLGDLRSGGTYLSIGRIQLLVCVVAVATEYMLLMSTDYARHTLPSVPFIWVALFGGSGLFYLTEKAYGLWRR